MDDPRHIETSRLVCFLIDESPLMPDEHEHLLDCKECMNRMVESAMEELTKRQSSAKRKKGSA